MEKEKKTRCEALVQSSERLEQLVCLQTRMRLEQQAATDSSSRVIELENEQVQIQQAKSVVEQENASLRKQVENLKIELDRTKGALSTFNADQLLKTELNNALTAAVQQKSADIDVSSYDVSED